MCNVLPVYLCEFLEVNRPAATALYRHGQRTDVAGKASPASQLACGCHQDAATFRGPNSSGSVASPAGRGSAPVMKRKFGVLRLAPSPNNQPELRPSSPDTDQHGEQDAHKRSAEDPSEEEPHEAVWDEPPEAPEAQTPPIDFVTLGMLIIGKAQRGLAASACSRVPPKSKAERHG